MNVYAHHFSSTIFCKRTFILNVSESDIPSICYYKWDIYHEMCIKILKGAY